MSTMTLMQEHRPQLDWYYSPPLPIGNKQATASLNKMMKELFMHCGDPLGSAMEAVKMDSKCSLAYSSVGILCCQSNAVPFSSTEVLKSLKLARSNQTTKRDEAFASALESATRGHVRASAGRLDTWLAQNPSDMLALIFCHNYYMKLGDSNLCKDLVGRLLPLMDPSSYDYAYSLSIMALGLVESGDLTEGEQWADRAIEAQPQNVYALHAKVNALELTGRSNEGESLMRQKDPTPFDLVDSSALLWNLKLNGTDVGVERWLEVAESWCKHDHLRQCSFTDLHTVMVYSELASHGLDTWREKAEQLIAPISVEAEASTTTSMEDQKVYPCDGFTSHHPSRWGQPWSEPDNVWVWNMLGRHIARAFLEYCDTSYTAACDRLMPFRTHLSAIGYTRVRRDIITMTLLDAACRSNNTSLGLALASERLSSRRNSAQAWKRFGSVLEKCGDEAGAVRAYETAYQLGLGQYGLGGLGF
eukprot:55199_1